MEDASLGAPKFTRQQSVTLLTLLLRPPNGPTARATAVLRDLTLETLKVDQRLGQVAVITL